MNNPAKKRMTGKPKHEIEWLGVPPADADRAQNRGRLVGPTDFHASQPEAVSSQGSSDSAQAKGKDLGIGSGMKI